MTAGGAAPHSAVPVAHGDAEHHPAGLAHDGREAESLWDKKTLVGILAFGGCNSVMLVINKMALHLLPVPSLVLVAQLVVSALFCQVGAALKVLDNDAFERDKIRAFFPAVCGFLAALFCNAKVLEHANVETFIVVRSSSPLLVAVSDWYFMGRELPDTRSTSVLFVILFSALAYVQKATLSLGAIVWSSAWLVVFTFDQCYIKHVCDTVPMTSWGRVSYSNALAIVPAIILGAIFREYGALRGYVMSRHAFLIVLLSCICGVAMSFSAFYLRAQISATAFTVVGILCKFFTVLISLVVFQKHASPGGLAALTVCLCAGAAYRPAPMRAAAAKDSAANTNNL